MNFAYDGNGRRIKTTATNTDAYTLYDALGNRVGTRSYDLWRYMIYDAYGKLIAEYGAKSQGQGGVKYVQSDWQGSVRTITNDNGFVVSRNDYQAFGGEIGFGIGARTIEQGYSIDKATKQGYGLTEEDESTGQQHAWARKLESEAGRWTRPDPYNGSMEIDNPQSLNRYSYVTNDPINYIDPSGLALCIWAPGGLSFNCTADTSYYSTSGRALPGGGGTVSNIVLQENEERNTGIGGSLPDLSFSDIGAMIRNRNEREKFIQLCLQQKINDRVALFNQIRTETLNENFIYAASGGMLVGERAVKIGKAFATGKNPKITFRPKPHNAVTYPLRAANSTLYYGAYEAVVGSWGHRRDIIKAKKPTEKDKEDCNILADQAKLPRYTEFK